MKTIWKFSLAIEDEQTVSMPEAAMALSVHVQNGTLCLWALVDDEARRVERKVFVRGTGHPCEGMEDKVFVGTVLMRMETLVFHVFIERSKHQRPKSTIEKC